MNRSTRFLIALLLLVGMAIDCYCKNTVTKESRFRIEKLSTPTIRIGNKTYKEGDVFQAGDEVKWTEPKQSMLVKNMETSQLMRFSKRISEKKGKLKSLLDLYVHSSKMSTKGPNDLILEKSENSGSFNDKRIALIVGNQNYQYIAPLKSAQKDAEDIAETLLELGFDILELYETGYTELIGGINKFSGLAKDYDVAVVYYSGHGIQEDGINYLVPVDNMLDKKSDLRDCVSCNDVVEKVENSEVGSRIFYFDACRDRKTVWSRSVANGLTSMEGAPGTVIVFAAESGKTASDGERDGNSPFAVSLIKNMKQPSKSFSEMMDGVVRDTYAATDPRQYPVRVGTLITDFQFTRPTPELVIEPIPNQPSSDDFQGDNTTAIEVQRSILDYRDDCSDFVDIKRKKGRFIGTIGPSGLKGNWDVTTTYDDEDVAMGNQCHREKNDSEAIKWYRKAAEKGSTRGQVCLGDMYRKVICNHSEAFKWYMKAAEQGDMTGQAKLGYMYDMGLGVAKDYSEACKWYRKAAEKGNLFAQNNLGYMYRNGLGVERDFSEAEMWYRKAAESGSIRAMYNLGYLYYRGFGVDRDYAEAEKWFRKAAEKGDKIAMYVVGYMYEKGMWVDQDLKEAIKWYKKSADKEDVYAKEALVRLVEMIPDAQNYKKLGKQEKAQPEK